MAQVDMEPVESELSPADDALVAELEAMLTQTVCVIPENAERNDEGEATPMSIRVMKVDIGPTRSWEVSKATGASLQNKKSIDGYVCRVSTRQFDDRKDGDDKGAAARTRAVKHGYTMALPTTAAAAVRIARNTRWFHTKEDARRRAVELLRSAAVVLRAAEATCAAWGEAHKRPRRKDLGSLSVYPSHMTFRVELEYTGKRWLANGKRVAPPGWTPGCGLPPPPLETDFVENSFVRAKMCPSCTVVGDTRYYKLKAAGQRDRRWQLSDPDVSVDPRDVDDDMPLLDEHGETVWTTENGGEVGEAAEAGGVAAVPGGGITYDSTGAVIVPPSTEPQECGSGSDSGEERPAKRQRCS